uniref:Hypothetical secreted protein n=1 Tax=Simulium nigrimanum TaxID=683695 RepID=D1FPU9_SIMNI
MIKFVAIQLALWAAVATKETPINPRSPAIWEYARTGSERHFYLNTYPYCNDTKKAMESPKLIELKSSTYYTMDAVLNGKGKQLGCGEVTLKGGDFKDPIVCGNFRNNWTEGLCRVQGTSVEYTITIYDNIHVYKRT